MSINSVGYQHGRTLRSILQEEAALTEFGKTLLTAMPTFPAGEGLDQMKDDMAKFYDPTKQSVYEHKINWN